MLYYFLSQSRLYPVDKTRTNEYGMSFEEDKAISTKETEVKNDENNDKQKETTGETKEALEQESKKDR